MLDYETVIGTEGSSFTAALTICHCVHERSENGDLKFNVQYSDKLYIAKGFFGAHLRQKVISYIVMPNLTPQHCLRRLTVR